MKVGDRIIVSGTDFDSDTSSLLGEKGTVTRLVNPDWKDGCDVVVALDCGIDELLFDSELELDLIKE